MHKGDRARDLANRELHLSTYWTLLQHCVAKRKKNSWTDRATLRSFYYYYHIYPMGVVPGGALPQSPHCLPGLRRNFKIKKSGKNSSKPFPLIPAVFSARFHLIGCLFRLHNETSGLWLVNQSTDQPIKIARVDNYFASNPSPSHFFVSVKSARVWP